MASSSGTLSGSPSQQEVMDQKKRKRMESNRESARRSRMRKQKLLDDLTAQEAQLNEENKQILTTIKVTKQHTLAVEAENSVLKAQVMELTQRLQSLNEILSYINSTATVAGSCMFKAEEIQNQGFADGILNDPWNFMGPNQHPIMASADVFDY